MRGSEAQEVLFFPSTLWAGPQSSALALLGPSLSRAGLQGGTAYPGVYKQSQGNGWGRVGKKTVLTPLAPTPLTSPFLQAQKWKTRVVRPAAPHKPDEGSKRENSPGHSLR